MGSEKRRRPWTATACCSFTHTYRERKGCSSSSSPGRGDPSVAGGGAQRNPRTHVPYRIQRARWGVPPFPTYCRSPETAWQVCGFDGACEESDMTPRH